MKKLSNVKIGADIEVFLFDKNTDRFISAIGMIGGSKYDPIDGGHGIMLQEDNVAAEWAQPIALSEEEFVLHTQTGLKKVQDIAEQRALSVAVVSTGLFDNDQLLDPMALQFGCSEDYTSWTKSINTPPDPFNIGGLRSAAGHIHIGYDNPEIDISCALSKATDLFLGVPSILMDEDRTRRQLYGKAGCIRIKEYGVEVRTLGNFWIRNEESIRWTWRQLQRAIKFVEEDQEYLLDNHSEKIIKAINEYNVELAEELTKTFNLSVLECVAL